MVECDGPGAVQALPDQNLPHGTVQVGHLDPVGTGVSPVHLPPHSVYCQTVCSHQTCGERERGWGEGKRERDRERVRKRFVKIKKGPD